MISGKRVLCGAQPIYGHTIPTLALALELRAAGNEINVLSYPGHMDRLFDRYGVTRTEMPMSKPSMDARSVSESISVLESYGPDITICDWRLDLWCALQVWRPPCRVSILRCEQLLGYQRRNLLLPDKFGFESQYHIECLNEAIRRIGLTLVIGDPRELYRAEVVVVPSVPQINPLPDRVEEFYPDTIFVYTGPLLLSIAEPVSESLQEWFALRRREGAPILLITLGTVGWGTPIFKLLADCFEATDLAIVMVVPFEKERQSLEQRRGRRFWVTAVTDLCELASCADVVLHHCGQGTLHTVVLAGKPSVTLPSGEYDREDNGLRLEDLGCGRHLGHDFFRHGFNPDAMSAAVKGVLRDAHVQRSVAAMSRIVREYVDTRGPAELVRVLTRAMA